MTALPLYSMTGFATLSNISAAERSITLTVKSVNHRHLDLQVRIPMGMDALESGIRKAVKSAVRRGHVELTCSLEKESQTVSIEWNEALVAAHITAFRRAAERFGIDQQPDLNAILRLPGVTGTTSFALDPSEIEQPLLVAVDELLGRFNLARSLEGQSLAEELCAGLDRLDNLVAEARALRVHVAAQEFVKLKTKLRGLLESETLPDSISEDRLLAEAALLATRSDVEEELVRLRTHIDRFRDLLSGGGELGRQLDFLLQEMNREANTLMSKTGSTSGDRGLRLTEVGLEIKVELERAREQVQNLE